MSNPKKSLSLSGQVHIDELPPEARKRVLSQIEGTAASEPKADTMSASNPRPTFEELKKAMLSHGLSIDGGGREELFRRLHHILFVSEHVRHIEEVTGRSYIDFCHGSLIRQVCRDRRNEREIMAAWKRGEKTYGGKRIGAHGQYVWRWEREDAQDALEMIEEALRDYPACATKADIMSASGPDTLSPRKRKYCPCPVCGHRFVSLLDDGTLGGHQRSDDPDPLCRGLVRCPASGTSPNTLSPGEEKTFRRFVALGKQVDKPLGKLIALGIEVRAIFARKPRGVPVQYAGQSYKDFEDFVSRNLPVSGRQMRRILAKEGKTDQRFANKLEPKSLPRNPEVGKIHVFDRKSVQDIVNRMPHIVGDGKLIGQYRSLFRDSEPPLPAGSYYVYQSDPKKEDWSACQVVKAGRGYREETFGTYATKEEALKRLEKLLPDKIPVREPKKIDYNKERIEKHDAETDAKIRTAAGLPISQAIPASYQRVYDAGWKDGHNAAEKQPWQNFENHRRAINMWVKDGSHI